MKDLEKERRYSSESAEKQFYWGMRHADVESDERYDMFMAQAHHKYLANHYRKKLHKKK